MQLIKIMILSLLFCFCSTPEKVLCMEEQSQEENQSFIWRYILSPVWNVTTWTLDFFVVKPVTFMTSLVKELIFGVSEEQFEEEKKVENEEKKVENEGKKVENDDNDINNDDIQKAIALSLSSSSDNSNEQNINEIGTTTREKQEDQDLAAAIEKSKIEYQQPSYSFENIIIEDQDKEETQSSLISTIEQNPDITQEQIKKLLLSGASLEERDNDGNTPLHIAITHGKTIGTAARILVEAKNKSINLFLSKNNTGQTPMHLVVQCYNHQQVINFFNYLTSKINPQQLKTILQQQDSNGNTPLHLAASQGKKYMISVLIDKCPESVLQQNYDEKTPAQLAEAKGYDETAAEVIASADRHKIDLFDSLAKEENPLEENIIIIPDLSLHRAIKEGQSLDEIRSVLNNAQKLGNLLDLLQAQDDMGNTPFHLAVESYDIPTFNSFLEFCSETFNKNIDNDETLSQCLNIQNNEGNTPLHTAATMNKTNAAQSLISYGADIRIENKATQTPLDLAIAEDKADVVKTIYDQTSKQIEYDLEDLIKQAQKSPKVLNFFYRIKASHSRLTQQQKQIEQ